MESDNNILQQIRHLRLMDDVLMVKCFENDKECTELGSAEKAEKSAKAKKYRAI